MVSTAPELAGNCKPAVQVRDASIEATVGQPGSLHGPSRRWSQLSVLHPDPMQPGGGDVALYF